MSPERNRSPILPTAAEVGFVWLRRIAAIYCLFVGADYWIRLIGIHPGDLWRFDLMPDHWKVAATALALLFPVAATGLWLLAPWGPVIWVAAAAIESMIYTVFSDTFGFRPLVPLGHALILAAYVWLRLTILWQKRRSEELARAREM
jgi:hypothetical protein